MMVFVMDEAIIVFHQRGMVSVDPHLKVPARHVWMHGIKIALVALVALVAPRASSVTCDDA